MIVLKDVKLHKIADLPITQFFESKYVDFLSLSFSPFLLICARFILWHNLLIVIKKEKKQSTEKAKITADNHCAAQLNN